MITETSIATRLENWQVAQTPITRAVTHQIVYGTLRDWVIGYSDLSLPVVYNPQLPAHVADAITVQTTCALQFPLGMIKVKEQCGHVYLVATKQRQVIIDPELPIALLDLGDKYAHAFAKYTQHITAIKPYFGYWEVARWWKRARRLCNKCLAALEQVADRMTVEELVYLVLKMQQPLAWPTGKS